MTDQHELLVLDDEALAAESEALEQRPEVYSALYAHWERNQWSALALDLETDKRSFAALSPEAQLQRAAWRAALAALAKRRAAAA